MLVDCQFEKNVLLLRNAVDSIRILADIPRQVCEYFPGVERVFEVEPAVMCWRFKSLSFKNISLEIECYTSVRLELGRLSVVAVPGRGNAQLNASWDVSENASGGAHLNFTASFSIHLDVPVLLRPIAQGVARHELVKLFDSYLQNVEKALR